GRIGWTICCETPGMREWATAVSTMPAACGACPRHRPEQPGDHHRTRNRLYSRGRSFAFGPLLHVHPGLLSRCPPNLRPSSEGVPARLAARCEVSSRLAGFAEGDGLRSSRGLAGRGSHSRASLEFFGTTLDAAEPLSYDI